MRVIHNQPSTETTRHNLTDIEVSQYLHVSISTVRRWRLTGGGPRWVRIGGGSIRYPLADLEAYVASLPSGGGVPIV
jgi:predicted DNA-binding transcriptional regulator AlpA